MGYSLNYNIGFGTPFHVVHEQIVDVAPNHSHRLTNPVRKLLFVLYGECRHQVETWNGAGGDVHLRAGDVLALPHHCVQRYSGVQAGSGCRLHVIRLAFLPILPALPLQNHAPVAVPDDQSDLLTWADFATQKIMHLRAAQNTALQETLLQLQTEAQNRAPGYPLRLHGLCSALTLLFARAAYLSDTKPLPSSAPTNFHTEKIKAFLRRHLHAPLSLDDVAAYVGLSKEHTARLFKSATGVTISQYTRRLRITEAKSRITTTDANLSEIARQVGFSSLTVFSRNFTHETGLTPSEFRQRIAEEIG